MEALALELTPQEGQWARVAGTNNVEAYDAYLLGLSFYYRRTPESYAQAKAHLERAIELDPNYSAALTTLAKIYAQSGDEAITYPMALGINWREAFAKARWILTNVKGQPSADVHVVRSWLALIRHQHRRAIAEAERALEINPNDVDAREALEKAQIYAGQPKTGIELVKRAMRQDPRHLTRSFLLTGLAEYALGNPDKAAEYIERAFELGSEEIDYAGIQAATYGELGRIDQAKAAYEVFRQGFIGGSPILAWSMVGFRFSDPNVLERLARGLELAGVTAFGGYLPLHESTRLSGKEIDQLLSEGTIVGSEFWNSSPWERRQTADGTVEYGGHLIQPGVPEKGIGTARIKDNLLCEEWSTEPQPLEICSAIFRIPESNPYKEFWDYVMVTDTGPHPFRLAQ